MLFAIHHCELRLSPSGGYYTPKIAHDLTRCASCQVPHKSVIMLLKPRTCFCLQSAEQSQSMARTSIKSFLLDHGPKDFQTEGTRFFVLSAAI